MSTSDSPIPEGFCQCGCAGRVSDPYRGKCRRFVNGHNRRLTARMGCEYVIDPVTGCWAWQGAIIADGYGAKYFGDNRVLAHRLYYEAVHGSVPEGMTLDHLCRNRACCNPEHLEVVTQAVNVQRGALAKLNWEQVHEIRQSAGRVSQAYLARTYGVSETQIRKIIANIAWRE